MQLHPHILALVFPATTKKTKRFSFGYWSNITMNRLFLETGTNSLMRFLKPEHSAFHIFNHRSSLSNRIYCSPLCTVSVSYLALPLKMSKDAPLLSLGCRMRREALIYSQLLLQERGPPLLQRGPRAAD